MIRFAFAILVLAGSSAALADQSPPPVTVAAPTADLPAPPKTIAKALKSGDGLSQATAYKVSSVAQEYEILRYLGLQPRVQSLIIGKKPYDVIRAVDPVTGKEREVWFDISKFFGRY